MKFSVFAFLILFLNFSNAQLSVQNDAYIYVNDEQLFVTDYVNIDDIDSKIYLRNEAQLLQDFTATTSSNSGLGQLSVYQTGTANQWSYNYWCSPVGNNSAVAGNEDARINLIDDATGLITSTDAAFTTGYNGASSPLTISDRWLWTYQISDQYIDWIYAGSTGNISPGLGFTMKGNGTGVTGSQVYDFRGKPNNGTIANSVANGLNTLIGNPYPSAMDSAAFIHDANNSSRITGTLLFWEQSGAVNSHVLQDYQGGYSAFTIDASGNILTNTPAVFYTYDEQNNGPFLLPGPGLTGSKQALRYIPIGQGFMVEGAAGTAVSPETIYIRNSHRVYEKESDGNSYFFRSINTEEEETENNTSTEIQFQENGLSIVPEDYKRFRINVDFTVNGTQYTRPLILNFHDSATAGFDYGLELIRNESLDNDAYFFDDNTVFSGQAFPFETTLAISLAVDIEEQQALRFRIFDIQNFDESQGIYLHDAASNTYVNLKNLDYELNIEPGNYADRFEIVFTTQGTLGIDELDFSSLTVLQNNTKHELAVFNPNALDIKTIEVFDLVGKRVLNLPFSSINETYNISTINLSNGVYVVNVASNNSTTVKSQKIIVKN